jgi:cyclophilin family peptidyl-prolyl cis-trans isomerase
MSKFPVIRDLWVDRERLFHNLKRVKAWVPIDGTYSLGEGPNRIARQAADPLQAQRVHVLRLLPRGLPPVHLEEDESKWDTAFLGAAPDQPGPPLQRARDRQAAQGRPPRRPHGPGRRQRLRQRQNCVKVCPKEIPLTESIAASATVDPDENYRVQLLSSVIRGTNGCLLDGEFNGPGVPTGDGVEGGDLQFFTRSFQANPIVRISTNLGDIDVEMFSRRTPLHVENFFGYMNRGDYDNVIFHRSVEGFVVQGGGFSNEGGFPRIFQDRPVQNEPGISNLRGTIALAKLGGDPAPAPTSSSSTWATTRRTSTIRTAGSPSSPRSSTPGASRSWTRSPRS